MNASEHEPDDIDAHEAHADVQDALQRAFVAADQHFADYIGTHWRMLGTQAAKAQLSSQSDLPGMNFSRRHLLNTLQQSRARLAALMKEVANTHQFADGCYEFIEAEMAHLFYVSNNRAEAQIVRDYFERFLAAATGAMHSTGHMSKDAIDGVPSMLLPYYDIGFEAYEDLRALIHDRTNGASHSPVAYALAQTEDDRNLKHLPKLAEHSEAGKDMVMGITQEMVTRLLSEHYRLDRNDNRPMHYTVPWVAARAREVSLAQAEHRTGDRWSSRKAMQDTKDALTLEYTLLGKVGQLLDEDGPIYGLLDAQKMFSEFRAEVNKVPEHFDEMLEDALLHAHAKAFHQYPARFKQHVQRYQGTPTPRSAKLMHALAPARDTLALGQHTIEEMGVMMRESMRGTTSLRGVARSVEMMADWLGERVSFGTVEPSTLLYLQDFIGEMRRDLGAGLHDAGMFDPKELARLKMVEEKCQHYYDSFHVLRQWTLQHTGGAYDRPMMQEYMQYAQDTGTHYEDVPAETFEQQLMPQAKGQVGKMLRSMGLNSKDYEHAMMPLLVDKASRIAIGTHGAPAVEDGATPEAADEAERNHFALVQSHVQGILHDAVKNLSKRDAVTGELHARQPFKAKDVQALMKQLDGSIALQSPKGRA